MRFFIDNNLSEHLAAGMAGLREDVVHLKGFFEEDEDDDVWLADIGERGWFLITRDERVRHRPIELEAIREHGVGAFFLGGKNRSRCELIQQLVRHWPRLKDLANRTKRPFAFRIPPSGTKIGKLPL
jgi:hypothetical protein